MAVEVTRTSSCEIEFWPMLDPNLTEGSREMKLDAYRAMREELLIRLHLRLPLRGAPKWGAQPP